LKVSRGRLLPGTFAVPEWPRLVDGCLSRTVRDTALYLGMTQDPNTPLPTLGFVAGKSSRRLTIAVMYERMLGQMPDPEVRNAVADTAELCRQLGHVVEEAKPPLDQRELGEAAQRLGAVESQKRLTPSSRKRGCQGSRTVSNRARSGCASRRCGVDFRPADCQSCPNTSGGNSRS
jgi:Asp-tRNA(Asn)/Glu-tRNA(Gln) amidotransferase A subunit family amidase